MRKIYCDICGDEQLYESWVQPLKISFVVDVVDCLVTGFDEVCKHCRQAVHKAIWKAIEERRNPNEKRHTL